MNKITLFLLFIVVTSCKEIPTQNEIISNHSSENKSEDVSSSYIEEKKTDKSFKWKDETFKNFSFKIPDNLILESTLSSNEKRVYVSEEDYGFTIDVASVPNGYENSTIKSLIPEFKQFANAVTENQKDNFQDFKLIGYDFEYLGNTESFLVKQNSTDISSNKNILMNVRNHFILSHPYYCSITFSYPTNSTSAEATVKKIENSFKFPEKVKVKESVANKLEKSNKSIEVKSGSRASLHDTKKWILDKFKTYGNPDFTYRIEEWDLIILTTTNPKTAIEYTIPLCNVNVYKNSSHTFSSERITFSATKGRIKIDRDWKGFPHFNSSYDFDFQFSSEDNLIERLNDALENLKFYCPESTILKETF